MVEVPHPWSGDDLLTDAYQRGYEHGQGFACNNVPTLGDQYWLNEEGRVTVDVDNIRDVHQSLCFEAVKYSCSYFTAREFNESEYRDDLWEAFEAGTEAAILADLAGYEDEDYGIEPGDE